MDQNNSFILEQQQAMKRMREMSARATMNSSHKMPPAPPFVKTPQSNTLPKNIPVPDRKEDSTPPNEPCAQKDGLDNLLSSLNLPFISNLRQDSDVALILGLVLILLAENSDRLLLIALVYILL